MKYRQIFVDCTTIQNNNNVELVSIAMVSDTDMVYFGVRDDIDIFKSKSYYDDIAVENLSRFPKVTMNVMKLEIMNYLARCLDRQDLKLAIPYNSKNYDNNDNSILTKYILGNIKNSPGELLEIEWWFKNSGLSWVAFTSIFGGEHFMRSNNISCKGLSVEQDLYMKNFKLHELNIPKNNIELNRELNLNESNISEKYYSDNVNNAFWLKAIHKTFIEKEDEQ